MAIKKQSGGGLSAAEKAKRKAAEEAAKKKKKADDDAADAARAKKAAAAKKKAPVVSKPVATPAPPRGGPGAKTGAKDAPKPVANPVIKPEPPRGGPGAKVGTEDGPRPVTPTPTRPTTPTAPTPPSGGGGGGRGGGPVPAPTGPAPEEPTPEEPTPTGPAPTPTPVVTEPTLTEEERAARVRDEERAFQQAQQFATAGAVFRSTLKTFFPGAQNDAWIDQLFEAAKPRVTAGFDTNQILDLMLQNGETPVQFNNRFKGIFELDRRRDAGETVYVPSISEYIAGEEEYTRLVTKFGMSNLGTIDNYATIVGNDVSIDEVKDRIATATARVNALDSATMDQLRVEFPNLQQSDLVQAILNKETPQDLQNRITRAEIGVEAKQAGIVTQLGTQALQEAGVTRAEARKGFKALAEYQRTAGTGIQQTQAMFGDTTPATDLQKELESEALLGQTSKKRKRLESQARAEFGGQSGITTGSLARKKQV